MEEHKNRILYFGSDIPLIGDQYIQVVGTRSIEQAFELTKDPDAFRLIGIDIGMLSFNERTSGFIDPSNPPKLINFALYVLDYTNAYAVAMVSQVRATIRFTEANIIQEPPFKDKSFPFRQRMKRKPKVSDNTLGLLKIYKRELR